MDSNVSTEIMQKVKAKDVASLCRYDKKDLAEAMLSLYHKYCNAEFRADLINIPLAHIAQEEWKEKFEKKQNEYEELEESRDRIQNDYDDLYDQMEDLRKENDELRKALNEKIKHQGGSRTQYSPSQRRAIVEYYQKDGETYKSTAEHFNISTNTVGRILKEYQDEE